MKVEYKVKCMEIDISYLICDFIYIKQERCDPDAIGTNDHFMVGCVSLQKNLHTNKCYQKAQTIQ